MRDGTEFARRDAFPENPGEEVLIPDPQADDGVGFLAEQGNFPPGEKSPAANIRPASSAGARPSPSMAMARTPA
jgi:hypothetical protein